MGAGRKAWSLSVTSISSKAELEVELVVLVDEERA